MKGATDFIHRYVPSSNADRMTLLTLHGTGGNENDLIPLARQISPSAGILSPRGKVLENGMPRFFRRLADGVFDIEDLKSRTGELAHFVRSASESYNFDPARIVALGYSNGANVAASLLLLRPQLLAGAILLRPMVPIIPETLPNLNHQYVLILAGREDTIVPMQQSDTLQGLLTRAGAEVQLRWVEGGHSLVKGDLNLSRSWLLEHFEKK